MRELLPTYSKVSGCVTISHDQQPNVLSSHFNHFYITINSINNQLYNIFNRHHPPLLSPTPSSTPQSSCLCSLYSSGFFHIAFPHTASCMPPCPLCIVRCQFMTPSCFSSQEAFPLCLISTQALNLCCWGCWSATHHRILPTHLH